MSDTDTDPDRPDADDDMLAAEFVLGALPAAEQAALAHRVDSDAGFARLVAQWEERLAPMAEGFGAVDPPPAVKRALDLRLFGQPAARRGPWSSLALWRGLAGVATAAFLLALALPALQPPGPQPPGLEQRLAASLRADGSSTAYLMVYDSATGRVSLAHLSGEPVAGRDFQLWIARGDEAPVSVGLIPSGGSMQMQLSHELRVMMNSTAHMAISLEPQGGSPTGQPTGPVLAVGNLMQI